MSEQDEYAKAFPQATKLDATKKQGVLLRQFIDWLLNEKGYWLAAEDPFEEGEILRIYVDPRDLILEFCDVDPVAYEAEIKRMLAQLRDRGVWK